MARRRKPKNRWWANLTQDQRDAFIEKKINEKGGGKRKERVDRQAAVLVVERMKCFGAEWDRNSAVRVPDEMRREIAAAGWEAWLKKQEQKNGSVSHF